MLVLRVRRVRLHLVHPTHLANPVHLLHPHLGYLVNPVHLTHLVHLANPVNLVNLFFGTKPP